MSNSIVPHTQSTCLANVIDIYPKPTLLEQYILPNQQMSNSIGLSPLLLNIPYLAMLFIPIFNIEVVFNLMSTLVCHYTVWKRLKVQYHRWDPCLWDKPWYVTKWFWHKHSAMPVAWVKNTSWFTAAVSQCYMHLIWHLLMILYVYPLVLYPCNTTAYIHWNQYN